MEENQQQNIQSINQTLSRIRLADKWAENTKLTRPKQPKIHKYTERSKRGGRQPRLCWFGLAHEPAVQPFDAGLALDGLDFFPTAVGGYYRTFPTAITIITRLFKAFTSLLLPHTQARGFSYILSSSVSLYNIVEQKQNRVFSPRSFRKNSGMALVAFPSFVRHVIFIEFSFQYIYDTLLHSNHLGTDFSIYYSRYTCLASLLRRCNYVGIMFIYMFAYFMRMIVEQYLVA